MNDRTAIIVTVVGSSVGVAALLLSVMTLLIGSVNTRIDDFRDAVNARIDDTKTVRMSPAMAAGLTTELRDMRWIVGLIDAAAPTPKKPGPKPGSKNRPRQVQ